ncbi:MAG: phage tail sheath subtilisin-like domain-containing protein, partial [Treponema sp.]|nr:phage tail sheath subtilisin-like domain-containing protein [Treponema sp.]
AAIGGQGGISAGNGVILGKSSMGAAGVLNEFASPREAQEILGDGELLKAVALAFNPSPDYTPQKIYAMVVNGNKQAERQMKSGENVILNLKSAMYGVPANQLKMQLSAGTDAGTKKVVCVFKGDDETKETIDNIGKESISLLYTGSGSAATVTIDNDKLAVSVADAADGIEILFEDFPTVEQIVARLNDTGVFAAIQLETESNAPANQLDAVTSQDVKTSARTLRSDLYALISALKSSYYVGKENVEKEDGAANIMPDVDADFVYFTGAAAGTYTVADWNEALGKLETEDVQIVSSPSTDHTVHMLISNHCTLMSSTVNRKERTWLLGGAKGEAMADALANAKSLNSKYGSYVYPAANVNSPLTGESEDVAASYVACMLLGVEAAVAVNEPLTWKNLSVNKFLVKLKIPEMEKLIKGGVLCCGTTDDNRLAVIRAMTAYQGGSQLQLVERSMVREDLYMNRDLRNRFSVDVGRPGISKGNEAEKTLLNAARDWKTDGLIVPNDKGENVWGIVARKRGDKTYIEFNRNLTAPQNFFFITAYNYIYDTASVEV